MSTSVPVSVAVSICAFFSIYLSVCLSIYLSVCVCLYVYMHACSPLGCALRALETRIHICALAQTAVYTTCLQRCLKCELGTWRRSEQRSPGSQTACQVGSEIPLGTNVALVRQQYFALPTLSPRIASRLQTFAPGRVCGSWCQMLVHTRGSHQWLRLQPVFVDMFEGDRHHGRLSLHPCACCKSPMSKHLNLASKCNHRTLLQVSHLAELFWPLEREVPAETPLADWNYIAVYMKSPGAGLSVFTASFARFCKEPTEVDVETW